MDLVEPIDIDDARAQLEGRSDASEGVGPGAANLPHNTYYADGGAVEGQS
jgi:hypothetical protein